MINQAIKKQQRHNDMSSSSSSSPSIAAPCEASNSSLPTFSSTTTTTSPFLPGGNSSFMTSPRKHHAPQIPQHQQAKELDDVSLVILGASGDLAKRKVFPAIYSLYKMGYLGENFRVVGYARTRMYGDKATKPNRTLLLFVIIFDLAT